MMGNNHQSNSSVTATLFHDRRYWKQDGLNKEMPSEASDRNIIPWGRIWKSRTELGHAHWTILPLSSSGCLQTWVWEQNHCLLITCFQLRSCLMHLNASSLSNSHPTFLLLQLHVLSRDRSYVWEAKYERAVTTSPIRGRVAACSCRHMAATARAW